MRLLSAWLCVGAVVSQGLVALSASALAPESATGPAAILARAWPFYDFTSASVKPWHLKASYQLYDAEGRHPQEGVFEYWWASPDLSRSTWTRIGLKHTDWHMANGHLSYESEGSPISLFEYKLEAALIAPLPRARDLDPGASRLELKSENGDRTCLTILPADGTGAPAGGETLPQSSPPESTSLDSGQREKGPYPTYCFEAEAPVLRSVYSFERVLTQFTKVRQTQGRFLAHGVVISEGNHKLLSATVDVVEPISLTDPALEPPPSAAKTEVFVDRDVSLRDVQLGQNETRGMLVKRVEPEYPPEARKAGIDGTVVLEAMIGTDGRIHDLRVISAPAASLAASSFAAVSQWEYRPYLLKGRVVPVQTTVTVTFSLGH
jgi:TonB family protein